MRVYVKTIFEKDKTTIQTRKVTEIDYCCDRMRIAYKECTVYFSYHDTRIEYSIIIEYEDIEFCPFCGKEIYYEYNEAACVVPKKITKTVTETIYVEEPI